MLSQKLKPSTGKQKHNYNTKILDNDPKNDSNRAICE